MIIKNIIGGRVQRARKTAKPPITQLDLVARLEVLGVKLNQTAVSKIERGRRPVYDYEIAAFSKALRVSTDWLLGLASNQDMSKHSDRAIR